MNRVLWKIYSKKNFSVQSGEIFDACCIVLHGLKMHNTSIIVIVKGLTF